jgi:hypothetical protein
MVAVAMESGDNHSQQPQPMDVIPADDIVLIGLGQEVAAGIMPPGKSDCYSSRVNGYKTTRVKQRRDPIFHHFFTFFFRPHFFSNAKYLHFR